MVPDKFLSISQLPTTSTGKIDRRSIRHAVLSNTVSASFSSQTQKDAVAQPRTDLEQKLQLIWVTVLGIKEHNTIGLADSFFELGGDSIDAMKVVGEARRVSLELTVSDIFRFSVMENLASHISSTKNQSTTSITKVKDTGPVEQSFAQARLWFLEQLYPGLSWYIMPCAVRLRGFLDLQALHKAVCALEERHETLRTIFYSEGDVNLQKVRPFREAKQRVVVIPPKSDDDVLEKALRDEQNMPFNLNEEPGWRVCVHVIDE